MDAGPGQARYLASGPQREPQTANCLTKGWIPQKTKGVPTIFSDCPLFIVGGGGDPPLRDLLSALGLPLTRSDRAGPSPPLPQVSVTLQALMDQGHVCGAWPLKGLSRWL